MRAADGIGEESVPFRLGWMHGPRRATRSLAGPTLAVVLILGLVGHFARDRNAALAVLMYLPIVPVGGVSVLIDLAFWGCAARRGRFLLTVGGLLAVVVGTIPMVGLGANHMRPGGAWSVTVLQWNVHWGGGPFRDIRTWAEQRAEILSKDADLVVLSEPPESAWFDQLVREIGPSASMARSESGTSTPQRFRMAVASRWPVRMERTMTFPGGHGMSVVAEVNGRTLRLLVVDGVSDPFRSRLPFLRAVAELCREEFAAGRGFDLIAGDFNTPAQSLGFDEWVDIGYRLASRTVLGWRGTFPSWLPVYDIDHVWVGPALSVSSCEIVSGVRSDHRGQLVVAKQGHRQLAKREPDHSWSESSIGRIFNAKSAVHWAGS